MATIVTRSGKGSPLTHAEVDANFTNLNTDKLELSGGTMTGNLSFGDNDKAIFGAGSDLQIYTDGTSNDYIDSTTAHVLQIRGSDVRLGKYTGETFVRGAADGAVTLYYDNLDKLATTSTGIDVTGTVTADGLTVDGDAFVQGSSGATLTLKNTNTTVTSGDLLGQLDFYNSDPSGDGPSVQARIKATSAFSTGNGASLGFFTTIGGSGIEGAAPIERMKINQSGDISFYEDTGTTAKFFWDASAESLGIGTTTPAAQLHINESGGTPEIRLSDGTHAAMFKMDTVAHIGSVTNVGLAFDVNSTEEMRLTSTGLGIGTSSPSDILHIESSTVSTGLRLHNTNTGGGQFRLLATSNTASIGGGNLAIYDQDNAAYRFVLDSSGNVGIGTSSPSRELDVAGNIKVGTGSTGGAWIYLQDNDSLVNGFYVGQNSAETANLWNSENTAMLFATNNAERMRIDSSGNVGIGTSSPNYPLKLVSANDGVKFEITDNSDANFRVQVSGANIITGPSTSSAYIFQTSNSERMRIDSSGNLLVGKSAIDGTGSTGVELRGSGATYISRDSANALYINRDTNDGDIAVFRKNGTTVGSIGVATTTVSDFYIGGSATSLRFRYDNMLPADQNGNFVDNLKDLGNISVRFDDIYATNALIQTSDQNEKQDIAELSEAEQRVAVAAKGLLRKFRWKDAVAEKGDEARTHFGIIAQDLQAAFAAEGLDAGDYAMFIHSTWTDEETGEERSRMGVRYSELLAFIIAAI